MCDFMYWYKCGLFTSVNTIYFYMCYIKEITLDKDKNEVFLLSVRKHDNELKLVVVLLC